MPTPGLQERITQDLQRAMKSGDKLRLETLRTIRAALMEKEIEKRGTGTGVVPEDEIAVLVSAAKKRKESIEMFGKGGRDDLVRQEQMELEIIREYLPKQASEGEILEVVDRIMKERAATTINDFGKVMPEVMKAFKGRAEGSTVQELVRRRLGG